MLNYLKPLYKLKYIIVSVITLNAISCATEEEGCETETICYGEGNCIEKPIHGTCF